MPQVPVEVRLGAPRSILLWTAALAFALRALIAARSACIYADGAIELLMAHDFSQGALLSGLRRVFHPLYAILIALLSPLQNLGLSAEATALLLSAAAGAATATTLVDITWRLASTKNRPARLLSTRLAAAWAILHPALALPSSQVLAFSLTQLCLALALRQLCLPDSQLRNLKTGALLGLGFLGRPDMSLAAFGAGLASLHWQRKAAPMLLTAGFLLLAGPYITWVSLESGSLRLSLKKDPAAWARGDSDHPPPMAQVIDPQVREIQKILNQQNPESPATTRLSWPRAALRALDQSRKAILEPILALALLGIYFQLAEPPRGPGATRFIVLASLSFLFGHTVLQRFAGYLSLNHCSYQTVLWLPIAASAGPSVYKAIRSRFRRPGPLTRRLLILILVLGPLAPRLADIYKAPLANKAASKKLGQRLSTEQAPPGGWLILGRECRALAYYAKADYLEVDELAQNSQKLREAQARGALLLVLYQRSLQAPPSGLNPKQLEELGAAPLASESHSERGRFYRWQLYKLERPAR